MDINACTDTTALRIYRNKLLSAGKAADTLAELERVRERIAKLDAEQDPFAKFFA